MKTHALPRAPTKRIEKKASVKRQGKKGEARFSWYPSLSFLMFPPTENYLNILPKLAKVVKKTG